MQVSEDEKRAHQHQNSQDKSVEEKLIHVGHLHLNSVNTSELAKNGKQPLVTVFY